MGRKGFEIARTNVASKQETARNKKRRAFWFSTFLITMVDLSASDPKGELVWAEVGFLLMSGRGDQIGHVGLALTRALARPVDIWSS